MPEGRLFAGQMTGNRGKRAIDKDRTRSYLSAISAAPAAEHFLCCPLCRSLKSAAIPDGSGCLMVMLRGRDVKRFFERPLKGPA
jgi:hypothetical protein